MMKWFTSSCTYSAYTSANRNNKINGSFSGATARKGRDIRGGLHGSRRDRTRCGFAAVKCASDFYFDVFCAQELHT